ncbi:hypothetical protein LTR84_003413 [Exophiala bonariae]|uniref:SCP domain-containing protein n=1 Tax=Exophiala bonariae TaxID=1690606 RepID=A0AAV9N774_9EURO|nr:hypothetical protein LTR84_003413 [Exophiala bonariae]
MGLPGRGKSQLFCRQILLCFWILIVQAATSVLAKLPTSPSSSSEESFYSCFISIIPAMTEHPDYHPEQDSDMSKVLSVDTEPTGTADEVNTALQAAQADWKKRKISTAEALNSVKAGIDETIHENESKDQNVQAGGKKCGQGQEGKSQKQMNKLSGSPAEDSVRKPYVPPYRLRSSSQNAMIERSILEHLPAPRPRNGNSLETHATHSPWNNNNLHGSYGTGADASLATHEAEAHVRMLAWENWALRNVLMYQYGWNRQGIDYALDIERQILAAGAPASGFNHG